MSRRAKVIGAATAGVLAVLAVALVAAATPLQDRGRYTVTAQFEDVVGLYEGNAVSILGMEVGTVSEIQPTDGYIRVQLQIDKGVDVPADALAVTVSNSILTDRQVELTPPYQDGPKLKDGDLIGLGRTRTPVEFDRTLAMMGKLGKAMSGDADGKGPLGDLVDLGAQVTTENGDQLKTTLDKLSQALRVGPDKGARSKDNIQAIVDSLSELTQAASENDAAIREFGSYVRQLSDILAAQDLGAGTTGAKANQLLEQATRILEDNRDKLKNTFADSEVIATTITDHRREMAELLDVGPMMIDNFYNTVDPDAGSIRMHVLTDKVLFDSQFGKELCNLMGLKQLGCATGTLQDYGPDFGLTKMLDLMADGIEGQR